MIQAAIRTVVATFIAIQLSATPTRSETAELTQLAAASCASFQSTCAARCRKDNPQDKNCVSDHCSPKLAQCRSTGCWQEGRRYGGGLTCNLTRG